MKTLLLKLFLFPLLGLVATLAFVVLTLPEQKVKLLVQRHLEKALDYDYRVDAVGFEMGLMSGMELSQVTLMPRFEASPDDNPGGPRAMPEDPEAPENQYFCPTLIEPMPVLIDRIAVDPSWLALVGGKLESSFEIEAAGGRLSGSIAPDDKGQSFKATLDALALQRFGLLRNKLGMHLVGQLGGEVELSFGEGMTLAGGHVALNLRNVVLCPKRMKMANPNVPFFELPLTRMGNITGRIEVNGRRLEFKNFEGEGEDMSLAVQGNITLPTPQQPKTRYDLRINLRPSDEWVQANAMDILFTMCKRFDDGSIQIMVTGETGAVKRDCVKPSGSGNAPVTRSPRPSAKAEPTPEPAEEVVEEGTVEVQDAPPADLPLRDVPIEPRANKNVMPMNRVNDRNLQRPAHASELRGKIDPVPEERRKQIFNAYDR